MVHVEGQTIDGIGHINDFFIDRYEVTNRQFKEFVDNDGYRKRAYWPQTFVKDGKTLSWENGIREFVDQTGRAGPAGWQAGDYPEGQGEFPVCGISWYEAAAYARYAGKSLPTAAHWRMAGRGGISSYLYSRGFSALLAPRSNFNGVGTVPVGSSSGITCYGAYDMAGNVREWCWNESPMGRVIRGGAWNDATYMMINISQASPFDRSLKNGFRCAVYPDSTKIPSSAFAPVTLEEEVDFYREKPVSNAIFQVYKEQFRYDEADLNARVEWRKEDAPDWICEKISFSAAYDNERMMAYLFLPVKVSPPFQTIIYFPGGGAFYLRNSTELENYWEFDVRLSYLVKNGRAVLFPIYKGTFERGEDALAVADENSYLYTEFLIKQVKDFKRCIDYLESRPEIDAEKLAYFGFSRGGVMGVLIPAVEDRIKVNIFAVGALFAGGRPEIRGINYVGHITMPTLMLNGRYDMTCPYETNVKPMYDLLGTPKEDKRLILYDSDHFIPRNEFIKEALNWLDHYLGPVK
ncbi:SUMF1/EgtB/PvdO family nonheme iron enzyme [bacterium]|nr:SUMF1/EgtB/PvdO family nonheme iron enzyme [bacterium]